MKDDQNVIYGGPVIKCTTAGCNSIGEVFLRQLNKINDTVVLVDGVTGKELTYSKLLGQSIRLAECLKFAGFLSGDVIGICSENCLEYPSVMIAAFMIGVSIAPINLTYTERELHHAVNLSKPKLIISSPLCFANVVNVAKNNKCIKNILVFGERSISGIKTLHQFINFSKGPTNLNFKSQNVVLHDHVALILCSSGTTGLPKGVQLTHEGTLLIIDRMSNENGLDCYLSVIPWFHSFGCISLLGLIASGQKLVYLPKFVDRLFLDCITKYKVTTALVVPPLMVFLAKHPLIDKYDLSSLKSLKCGAAPLSKEVENAVYQRIGVNEIRQGYGLSETTLGTLIQVKGFTKPGSVGGVVTGIYAKVVDLKTGESLGPNKQGELCFKGAQIMKGYIGDSEATQATIDKDGWLHTGDIGYYDNDKEFFIVDRLKELIKYKAFQVPPAEIEAILLTHPKVKDAAVIGVPDDIAGELPLAFIVKQQKVKVKEEEIVNYVAERVSSAKQLRGGVRFIDDIPKNPSGKILRRELRDLFKTQKSKL